MNKENKHIIVFSAHPDDHLVCAGTLMYFINKGYTVHEVVATGGEKGAWWDKDGSKKQKSDAVGLKDKRSEEIRKAQSLIGIDKSTNLGLPDGNVQKDVETVEKIVGIVRQERPSIVIAHNTVDYHPDHRTYSDIATEGVHQAAWTHLPERGEQYKTPLLMYMEGFYMRKADMVFDVTEFIDKKKELLEIYSSQIYPAEKRLVRAVNEYRGFFMRNHETIEAEAFEIPENYYPNFNRILETFAS